MKTTKLLIFSIALTASFSFIGCVKNDNPYPDIAGTSWYRKFDHNTYTEYQKLSFTENMVTHIITINDQTRTYNFNYYPGDDFYGSHCYSWVNDEYHLRYKVYSYGRNHIKVTSSMAENTTVEQFLEVGTSGIWYFTKE